MTAEFISITFPNASTDIAPLPEAAIDPAYLVRYARMLDDYGFTYTLIPYHSSSFDNFTIAATILSVTKNISVIVALRPNTVYPTVAAKALAQGTPESAFYEAKIHTARFYFHRILPRTRGHVQAIDAGLDTLMPVKFF